MYVSTYDSERCVQRVVCEVAAEPSLAGPQGKSVAEFMTSPGARDHPGPRATRTVRPPRRSIYPEGSRLMVIAVVTALVIAITGVMGGHHIHPYDRGLRIVVPGGRHKCDPTNTASPTFKDIVQPVEDPRFQWHRRFIGA
ncbi:hypothetical protein MTO96_049317 [Rhipicephalus appendiculatus]